MEISSVRMRTIKNCVPELRKVDPGTQVTEYAIRKLVLQGRIKFTRMGCKILVNFDSLLNYLANPPQDEEPKGEYGKLRKIIQG